MARGITEQDVCAAADALLLAGEKPTVERIRAHLGTGSPNTVTRHVDTWWRALGQRLKARSVAMTLPAAPPEVAALAGELWQEALAAAGTEIERAVAKDRAALAQEHKQIEVDRKAMIEEQGASAALLAQAVNQADLLSARLGDADRIIAEQAARLDELRVERQASAEREVSAQRDIERLRVSLDAMRVEGTAERRRLEDHVERVESRAATEIDRARQARRALETTVQSLTKSHAAELRALKAQGDKAIKSATSASLEAARQRSRADTLAKTIASYRAAKAKQQTPARAQSPKRPTAVRKVGGVPRPRNG